MKTRGIRGTRARAAEMAPRAGCAGSGRSGSVRRVGPPGSPAAAPADGGGPVDETSSPARPVMMGSDFPVPDDLTERDRWVLWRLEPPRAQEVPARGRSSAARFERASQAGVAMDRIRLAIRVTEDPGARHEQLREAGLPLPDAFDRPRAAGRSCQRCFRSRHSEGHAPLRREDRNGSGGGA